MMYMNKTGNTAAVAADFIIVYTLEDSLFWFITVTLYVKNPIFNKNLIFPENMPKYTSVKVAGIATRP